MNTKIENHKILKKLEKDISYLLECCKKPSKSCLCIEPVKLNFEKIIKELNNSAESEEGLIKYAISKIKNHIENVNIMDEEDYIIYICFFNFKIKEFSESLTANDEK